MAATGLDERRPGTRCEMARVKQVRVDVVNALRQEALDGAMQQRFVACRQFGDKLEGHAGQFSR